MRLLSYDSHNKLQISRDLVEDETPSYAILSHTWGPDEEEATLHDLIYCSGETKKGYRKIDFCGQQARKDGLEFFWVDTCCIDKTNNTELSKSITCMYRWYRNAQVRYVYLADVSFSRAKNRDDVNIELDLKQVLHSSFHRSRWFTRGWTLQELLAPKEVLFYSKERESFWARKANCRIYYARSRAFQATKELEDQAYCLLGIFNVYMPLMYGERDNALLRLKKKIASQAALTAGKSSNVQLLHNEIKKISQALTSNHEQVLVNDSNIAARLEVDACILRNEICQLRQALSSVIGQTARSLPQLLHTTKAETVSSKKFNFSFGKTTTRQDKLMKYSAAQQQWLWANRVLFDVMFNPSPLFWQTRIILQAECAVNFNSFVVPNFSLQFLDIVPAHHPVILASIRGDPSAMRTALASREVSPLCNTAEGWTLLHYAAAYGHTAACKLLIANVAPLHATGIRGVTPLHLAAHFAHLEIFKILVEAGIDPDEYHEHGLNAIFEILSIGASSASMNLNEFLQWLLHGQERFPLDVQARDNSQRSILYHLANPPLQMHPAPRCLTSEQTGAIECLLREGASGDELDYHQISLLHESCRDNRMDLVKLLLSQNCNVNSVDRRGYTALHYAVESGNFDLVSFLVQNGANVDVNASEDFYRDGFWAILPTPLFLAAMMDRIDMVRLLMQQGAGQHNENVTQAFRIALRRGLISVARYFIGRAKHQLDLHLAIYDATTMPDLIEELYRAGAPLDCRTKTDWTPLLLAASFGLTAAVKILVELGADLNQTRDEATRIGLTPLRYAVEGGHEDVVLYLLVAGAQTKPPNAQTPTLVVLATSLGYDGIANLLVPYCCDDPTSCKSDQPSVGPAPLEVQEMDQDCNVQRELTLSCQKGDLTIVERLLEMGCSLKAGMTSVWSPLHLAIRDQRWEVAKRLVQAGAELNSCGRIGYGWDDVDMPFIEALRYDNTAMVEFMIAYGADVNIRAPEGATPLLRCLDAFWSDNYGRAERPCCSNGMIVRALLKAGAPPNAIDDYGRTALGKAAALGNLEAVIALVEAGANLDKQSSQNSVDQMYRQVKLTYRTPIAWAAVEGHERIVSFLFDSGADWRCLHQEPAVCYTHRLLMSSCFPCIEDKASRTMTTISVPQFSTCKINSEQKGLCSLVDVETTPDLRVRSIEDSDIDEPDTSRKRVKALQMTHARIRNTYDRLQLFRLEIAALICVLLLLLAPQLVLYLSTGRFGSTRVAIIAMLAGALVTSWMNKISLLTPLRWSVKEGREEKSGI